MSVKEAHSHEGERDRGRLSEGRRGAILVTLFEQKKKLFAVL